MSLSFPPAPSVGQAYQQFHWDGEKWTASSVPGVTSYNGRTGAVMPQTGDETPGNRVLLATTFISTPVSSVDFFTGFDGTSYDVLEVDAYNTISSSAAAVAQMLLFSQDGATFPTLVYSSVLVFANTLMTMSSAALVAPYTNAVATGIVLGSIDNSANAVNNLRLRIAQGNATMRTAVFWDGIWYNVGANASVGFGSGQFGAAQFGPIRGLRFMLGSSATMTGGSFKLYGIKK